LKVSGVPDVISRREVSMATLERENHPNKRSPTGTVTLKSFTGSSLPERILTLVTKHNSKREERVQEFAVIRKR